MQVIDFNQKVLTFFYDIALRAIFVQVFEIFLKILYPEYAFYTLTHFLNGGHEIILLR